MLVLGIKVYNRIPRTAVLLVSSTSAVGDLLILLWGEVVASLLGDGIECYHGVSLHPIFSSRRRRLTLVSVVLLSGSGGTGRAHLAGRAAGHTRLSGLAGLLVGGAGAGHLGGGVLEHIHVCGGVYVGLDLVVVGILRRISR